MGTTLILTGLVGLAFGLINIFHPLGRLRIETRRQGVVLLGVSLVMIIVGGVVSPPTQDASVAGQGTTVSTTSTSVDASAAVVALDSTTTSETMTSSSPLASSSTSVPATTSPSPTTTSPAETLAFDLLSTIPIELETPSGYNRDLFPHWSDADSDGCGTRDEVLIRDSGGTARVGSGCQVSSGLWYSAYDGVWLDNAIQIQIDHVVALKEAWDSGAKAWDTHRREEFANDLDTPELIAVSSSSNHAKGDADPSNWLPANPDDQCRYVVAVVVVKAHWGLSMDQSEFGRIRNLLIGPCQGAVVSEATPVRPSLPATTSTSSTTTTFVSGSADVSIVTIVYDGPGNDVVYNDSEYLVLHNNGSGTADVGGWRITDLANHQIILPSGYSIAPGGELRVFTGLGDSTATKYFAGFGQAIWNNSGGDTATLYDSRNQVVDTYAYSS